MTDRELLELAAKAAGMDLNEWQWQSDPFFEGYVLEHEEPDSAPWFWNPITDDGDALRLAVKLKADLEFDDENCTAHPVFGDSIYVGYFEERLNPDPYAATRRAIVRAAAEIGRNMK